MAQGPQGRASRALPGRADPLFSRVGAWGGSQGNPVREWVAMAAAAMERSGQSMNGDAIAA